jgi:ribonuclease BN (tRNA processing enzyme)
MSKIREAGTGGPQPGEKGHPAQSLVNDGSLDLTFVGSGSAFSKVFYQNNLLVVKGGSHLLIDCGSRAPQALSQIGLSVGQVSNYLITHTHADHIGGLEEVMLVNRFALRKKTTMVVTEKLRKVLWAMSLRGGAAFNEAIDGRYLEFGDFWDQIEPRRLRG